MYSTNKNTEGFSLVEMMVVIAILAVLAAIAVVAMTRDNLESDFNTVGRRLSQDLQRAKAEAISSPEDRVIRVSDDGKLYTYNAALPGDKNLSNLSKFSLPTRIAISGVSRNSDASALPAQIRFFGTQEAGAITGSGIDNNVASPSQVTIYFKSDDGTYKARIIISQSTGFIKYYAW